MLKIGHEPLVCLALLSKTSAFWIYGLFIKELCMLGFIY